MRSAPTARNHTMWCSRPRLLHGARAALAAALLLAGSTRQACAAAEPPSLRVLLLSGRNNHDWKTTTPAIAGMLRETGRFGVDITDEPEKLEPEALARYDAVVSNWSPWPKVDARLWGPELEKAFLDFVRGGRGFVVIHAACTAFYTWPEFHQMVGAAWELGTTGHGRYHTFTVKITDTDHPVTRGMRDFRITDELWHRMRSPQPQAVKNVLCTAFSAADAGGSGEDEPVVFCGRLGAGRCFQLVLGHDVPALRNVGCRTLLVRGTEWAATGRATIPVPAIRSWSVLVIRYEDS